MASSLFIHSFCRSTSNQVLKSYHKFSPIISYSQNQKSPIVSNLLSNRSFSHDNDHDHMKKLLNPSTSSTSTFSDSTTTLSKFLASTQEKLLNPNNPSFITSSSTCDHYPLNKNLHKTHYTNFVSSNLLSNPCRNLGLIRSFSTSSSSDKPAFEVAGELAFEMQKVVRNMRQVRYGLILLSYNYLCDGSMVWFQSSFGAFAALAFPLCVGCLLSLSLKQIKNLSLFDEQYTTLKTLYRLLQLSNRQDTLQIYQFLQCVKTLNIFLDRTIKFMLFLNLIFCILILKGFYSNIRKWHQNQNRSSNKSESE